MHGTGSTRMATRCSSSEMMPRRRALGTASLFLLALVTLASAACKSSSTYYVPTAGEPRINQDEFRDASDQILSVECPRLMGTSDYATGEARARVYVDKSGAVQKFEFTRPSSDERMNTVWGGLGARLQFDPQEGQSEDLRAALITIGYSCGKGTALTTFQL
jgi:hypothetical protein